MRLLTPITKPGACNVVWYAIYPVYALFGVAVLGLIVWKFGQEWRESNTKALDMIYGITSLSTIAGALICLGSLSVGDLPTAIQGAVLAGVSFYICDNIY